MTAKKQTKKKIARPQDWRPESHFGQDHAWAGSRRCQGWNGNKGEQCGRRPARGRDYCKKHGGAVPAGINHYNFKGRGYSKFLPASLAPQIAGVMDNPEMRELAALYDLLSVRILDLMSGLESGAGLATFQALRRSWRELQSDAANKRPRGVIEGEIGDLIESGFGYAATWGEIANYVESQRKIKESQAREKLAHKMVMTLDEVALALINVGKSFERLLSEHVDDRAVRDLIMREHGKEVESYFGQVAGDVNEH